MTDARVSLEQNCSTNNNKEQSELKAFISIKAFYFYKTSKVWDNKAGLVSSDYNLTNTKSGYKWGGGGC